jgi:exopolysaccharide/PEP-CTERM locus tyrosine autokinase
MSLIERALSKARDASESPESRASGQPGSTSAIAATGGETASASTAPARPPAPRVVAHPDLVITEALLADAGLLPPARQQRQVVSEYRHVKRRLLAEVQSGAANRMTLIASALPGEGKSFSSANLALSLALEPDYTVVLVDADVIKPNLTRVFGLLDRPGLMDAAADPSIDVESLIVSTNVEGLSLLPAGRTDVNATEYFASARMQALVDQLLAVPNRLLVVDSLPLLLTTEARALVPLAGQVVLVVRAESTPQQAVLQAVELLGEEVNVKLLLNAVVRTRAQSYMGYGYYGYNYNYGDSEVSASGEKRNG